MKWFYEIMGLKDKMAKQEAQRTASKKSKPKASQIEQVTQPEPVKIPKVSTKSDITKEDAAFIIAKLRQAEYKGSEFEQFYTIMTKLQKLL
jgi:hypothetical protein